MTPRARWIFHPAELWSIASSAFFTRRVMFMGVIWRMEIWWSIAAYFYTTRHFLIAPFSFFFKFSKNLFLVNRKIYFREKTAIHRSLWLLIRFPKKKKNSCTELHTPRQNCIPNFWTIRKISVPLSSKNKKVSSLMNLIEGCGMKEKK